MEALLIGLLGPLVGAYLTAHFKGREVLVEQIRAWAEFFETMAACLGGMRDELAKKKIPTKHGNRLKQALADYEDTINATGLSKATKKKLLGFKSQIEHCLTQGQAEDDILRGKILRAPALQRKKLLAELDRISARLLGQHDVLKATLPN